MIHFGFSYVGLMFFIMLFVPNLIWAKNKPKDYDKYVINENKVLLMIERIGEATTLTAALIFSDYNLRAFTIWSLWLFLAFLFMVLYELYWIRYFRSDKTMADMYSSYWGFPVAGASLPCLAFFCLGIYGTNIFLIVSALFLSVGHIGIHLNHRKEAVGKKKTKKIVKVIRVFLLIPVVLLLLVTVVAIAGRNINWFRFNTNTANGIDEMSYVEIGGQEQYIHIMGKDINNPVILYLHGGPAGPDSAIMPFFTDPLAGDYTVVCWDQRGCGRTYFHNAGNDPDNLTVNFDTAVSDIDGMVDYLCERFNKDKVTLMCHSYGTIVGTRYVQEHSEKVEAYIGIGQFVNCRRSDELAYENAMAAAKANGEDTSSLEEAYKTYCEGDSLKEYLMLRNATSGYHPAENKANTALLAVFCPYAGTDDVRWVMKQADLESYEKLEGSLMDATYDYDVYDYELEYDIPMYFISGSMDYVCNTSLTKTFSEDITAPRTAFAVIEGGGHTPQYETPEAFGEMVKQMLKLS
ncbi:MAG: alpha/beta fold hydrolase [Clostridiales bacterium]|nr:alpha/beta fold hydrolase [Clostridiales bacterium]